MMVKVTLGIISKNEEKNIANTLKSVLSLDFSQEKYEIILVDGNSDDNTREIAKKILETGSFTAINAAKEKMRFSTFILTATSFMYHYYSLKGNLDAAKTYLRMHETHKKYWITR